MGADLFVSIGTLAPSIRPPGSSRPPAIAARALPGDQPGAQPGQHLL